MEIPSVRILNDGYDTPDRQFPVETAIQLTCQGEVGSDQTKVRFNAMEGKIDLQKLFSFFFNFGNFHSQLRIKMSLV